MSEYVATWPGLRVGDMVRRRACGARPFPFNAPEQAGYYRERNALYHLFRALRRDERDWALVPDYHHGNEVRAIRAAGFGIRFYPVGRDFTANLGALLELCEQRPRVLVVIHYLGWSQPLDEVLSLCQRLDIVTVEDCALSLLSEHAGAPLGSRADYSLFCLYKTLPVPNGGLLVQNRGRTDSPVSPAALNSGATSLIARTLTLGLEGLRARRPRVGGALTRIKETIGAGLTSSGIRRWPVGDDGFDLRAVGLRMSRLTQHLLDRFDYADIRARRRANFVLLRALLADCVALVREDLPSGVCPLFLPIVVADKSAAARALWAKGIGAVEFWNTGDPEARGPRHADACFLRDHVLELPIHQDVSDNQLEYMAGEVRRLGLQTGVLA